MSRLEPLRAVLADGLVTYRTEWRVIVGVSALVLVPTAALGTWYGLAPIVAEIEDRGPIDSMRRATSSCAAASGSSHRSSSSPLSGWR